MDNKMIQFRDRNFIQKHFEYFYYKLKLSFSKMKEYKIDFWSMMLNDIVLFFVSLLSYAIILDLTSEYLKWTYRDFILVFFFYLIMWKALWMHNLRGFNIRLLKGELNLALTKPLNVYFNISSELINFQNFITAILLFLISIIFILMGDYSNYFFAFIVFIFSLFYFMVFFNFLHSFDFFIRSINPFNDFLFQMDSVVRRFTPKTFSSFKFSEIFYFIPASISCYFVIEILNGRTQEFHSFFMGILFLFLLMILGIYILWKVGLRKYEAFG